MSWWKTSINVRSEERESLLDKFSECETFLKEEAAEASQLFEDLGRYCPDDLELCEPLHAGTFADNGMNVRFIGLLHELDIDNAADLANATGAGLRACENVMQNPVRCGGKDRAQVLKGLEESQSVDVFRARDCFTGQSVGESLARWARECFKTPGQFERKAEELELKCYLIGAVEGLKNSEVKNLLNAPSLANALKDAARSAREQADRGMTAAQLMAQAMAEPGEAPAA